MHQGRLEEPRSGQEADVQGLTLPATLKGRAQPQAQTRAEPVRTAVGSGGRRQRTSGFISNHTEGRPLSLLTMRTLQLRASSQRTPFSRNYCKETSMSRRLSLALLCAMFVYEPSIDFMPSPLAAVNCELGNALTSVARGRRDESAGLQLRCQITINDRKKVVNASRFASLLRRRRRNRSPLKSGRRSARRA